MPPNKNARNPIGKDSKKIRKGRKLKKQQEADFRLTSNSQSFNKQEKMARLLGYPQIRSELKLKQLTNNKKIKDLDSLESLLKNPSIESSEQLETLLSHQKVKNSTQLDRLLSTSKIEDTQQLERLLDSPNIVSADQLQSFIEQTGAVNADHMENLLRHPPFKLKGRREENDNIVEIVEFENGLIPPNDDGFKYTRRDDGNWDRYKESVDRASEDIDPRINIGINELLNQNPDMPEVDAVGLIRRQFPDADKVDIQVAMDQHYTDMIRFTDPTAVKFNKPRQDIDLDKNGGLTDRSLKKAQDHMSDSKNAGEADWNPYVSLAESESALLGSTDYDVRTIVFAAKQGREDLQQAPYIVSYRIPKRKVLKPEDLEKKFGQNKGTELAKKETERLYYGADLQPHQDSIRRNKYEVDDAPSSDQLFHNSFKQWGDGANLVPEFIEPVAVAMSFNTDKIKKNVEGFKEEQKQYVNSKNIDQSIKLKIIQKIESLASGLFFSRVLREYTKLLEDADIQITSQIAG